MYDNDNYNKRNSDIQQKVIKFEINVKHRFVQELNR